MKKLFTKLLKVVLLILVMLGIGMFQSYGQEFKDGVMQGKIRIKIKPSVAASVEGQTMKKGMVSTGIKALDKLNTTYAVTEMTRAFPYSPKFEGKHMKHGLHLWYEVTLGSKVASKEVARAYSGLPEVEIAEPIHETVLIDGGGKPVYVKAPEGDRADKAYFNDPYLKKQWHYNNTGQTGGTPGSDINLFNAWDITTGTPNVVISIHDQGVDYKHEDLAANMWVNQAEKNGQHEIDDDGNGYIDDIYGFNFTNNSGTIEPMYHGSHVGGTIAATNNNGIGVCGVAGGSGKGDGVRIMTCQILGGSHAGNSPLSYVYAADNGAVISQNSWGYSSPGVYDQAVNDAIDYFIAEAGDFPNSPMKGGVVIFAAGNSNTEEEMFPAAYPPVISVAALDAFSTRAGYSNYGTWVSIAAPGGDSDDNVLPGANTAYKNGIMSTLDKNGYGYLDGTSMACPHLSGVAGLVVSKYGGQGFTNADLKTHLLTGVREDIYKIEANGPMAGKLGTGESDAVLALGKNNKIAPAKITDLVLNGLAQDFADISWSVPADEDDQKPLNFEVIYSEKEITEANLAYARIITLKNNEDVGNKISYEITNLNSVTAYHFAIRGIDRWGNASDFSNQLTATTNSGPVAALDPAKPALTININVTQKSIGSDSITLSNSGEGMLIWDALPRNKDAQPLSVKPALQYPTLPEASASPIGLAKKELGPVILNNIQQDTTLEKGYVNQNYSLMVMGETNTKIPNSSATRFYVNEDEGFNLTYVDAFLQHDAATGPVICEIYEGYDISTAKLVLAQEVVKTSAPSYTGIQLNEELFFDKGSYFWVVLHVPAGNKFPLGAGLELTPEDSKNCYMSLNGGKTWKMFEELYYDNQVVWAVFALSRSVKLDQYITLNPVSGKVSPNHDTTLVASVDASKLINGTYTANLVVNTNETGKPMLRVPVTVIVQGHKPIISSVLRANFGNILVGTTKDLKVSFRNDGLGRFVFKSSICSLDNPQFTYVSGAPLNFEAATSQELTFRYTATKAGNNSCKVVLQGENGETYNFELFGSGMEPPVVSINPQTSVYNNLAIGDSINGHFELKNSGKYPLDFYMPAFADGSNMESIPNNVHKFGYSVKVDTTGASYTWKDIATTGTDVTSMFPGNGDNNIYRKFPLSFLFPFFGKNENFVYITKYGILSFDDHDYIWASVPSSYKNVGNPDRYISGAGFPMLFEEAGFGHIYYKQEPDKFIVQYDNVPFWDGTNYDDLNAAKWAITFQIVLSDNGNISIYYKANTISKSETRSNLVSIEDQTKDDGLLINGQQSKKWGVYAGDYTFKEGTSVLITNPGLGLFSNISHPYGTVMPNDSLKITYTLKTDSLYVLPYTENLVIITNDPYHNPTIHTAAFNITHGGISDVAIDSTSLDFGTLYRGTRKSLNFEIFNKGKATDSLVSAVFDNNYFTLSGSVPALLKPERSLQFSVTAKTQTLGVFTDTLRMKTSNGQLLKIALSINVVQGPVISLLNSGGSALTSVTKFLNAGNNTTVNFKIRNTGSVDLHVAPSNNDWATISETVPSASSESVMYTWKKSTEFGGPVYDWVEIAGNGGTKITSVDPFGGKDWSEGIKLPFAFKFFGSEYDTMYIGNGLVTFTPDQTRSYTFWGGVPIPDTAQPNNYIAPLWVFGGPDWVVTYPNSGIYYQIFDDRVIVEYRDYNSAFTMGDPISFEVILYNNGNIKFQYVMPTHTTNTVTDHGTIGIENEKGTDGVLISNYQKVVNQNMSITLYPAHLFTIPPGQTKDFKMFLDAKDLVEGSYADSIPFTNNDPDHLGLKLPTKLVVTGTPKIEVPVSLIYDTIQITPLVPTVAQEFEIKNTGTANFTLNSISQGNPADVKLEVYTAENGTWLWEPLNNYTFPTTLKAHSSLKMRSTITPVSPKTVIDTVSINTSLAPAKYKIPVRANIYTPATIRLGADTVLYYAQKNDFAANHAVKMSNEQGGLNLNYDMSIHFVREAKTANQSATIADKQAPTTKSADPDIIPGIFKNANPLKSANSIKSTNIAEDYNRVLAWDSDTISSSRLGYNGARAFYTATGFVAPADGFLLSHVQCWFVPGDWLSTKIKVMVYAGDEDIYNCVLLSSESFDYSTAVADEKGSLLTYKLSNAIPVNPNETFFVVFGFEAALSYPQGCANKTEIVTNRFLFGQVDDWYDLASYSQFNTIGWLTRAIEEKSGNTPWVVLTSAATGTVPAGASDSIHLSFTATTAPNGDNIAYLKVKSNDINQPQKQMVLRLVKNSGPVMETLANNLTVSENDSVTFSITGHDAENDVFTMDIDSTYKFLTHQAFTDPDPALKTLKYIYKPDFNSAGLHTFSFSGSDAFGNISAASVSINVKNVNRVPEPIDVDTLKFTPFGDYLIVGPYDVFADPDHDLAQLEAVSASSELMNMFVSGNSFLLMPGSSGQTSVTFMVTDKQGAKAINTVPISISDMYTGSMNPGLVSDLVIYPNPTKGEVHAILPSDMKGKVKLTIFNNLGVTVKSEIFEAGTVKKFDFDLGELPAGIYFVKFANDQVSKTGKILKQ